MSNHDIAQRDADLNQKILEGNALEAFDTYYADDVVMQEGLAEPRKGKQANRAYEEQFFGSIEEVHAVELHDSAVSGDRSYSEWTFDVTFQDGNRVAMTQVAARKWRDGKVAHERFYVAGDQ